MRSSVLFLIHARKKSFIIEIERRICAGYLMTKTTLSVITQWQRIQREMLVILTYFLVGLYPDILYDVIVGNWERKKPIWVMLMINSLTEADIKSRGTPVLDLYLARKAEKLGRNVGAVEKVEEQCLPLNNLKMSQVVKHIYLFHSL